MTINHLTLSGNLTSDSELRSTANGLNVLSFSLAFNERYKDPQTGKWESRPNFIDCSIFGARAESLSQYLLKGAKVSIDGKIRQRQWERDGQKRSKIEVVVEEIEFLSRKED